MATSVKVWVRLTIGDKKLEDSVHVATGGDISDLRDAVKLKFAEDLIHCSAPSLQVFQQEDVPFRLSANIPSTTEDNPLIIKAPTNNQEQDLVSILFIGVASSLWSLWHQDASGCLEGKKYGQTFLELSSSASTHTFSTNKNKKMN
mmetsp:Transcript_23363/g.27484  ORF Transcript_23363/g.27484 Transcript_23363/m.27484 type:complete len:146 (+) Transcript_23363:105-542(+)